jgi:hypothetical protein
MDVVSFAWSRAFALKPFPNCRSGVIGLAIAGNPENDRHLSPWQEALGQEDIHGQAQERLHERGIDGLGTRPHGHPDVRLARVTLTHDRSAEDLSSVTAWF